MYIFVNPVVFFWPGVSLWCCQWLKIIYHWQDIWLPAEIWKLSEGSTMAFALHNWGIPQKTPIRIVTQLKFRPVYPEYSCNVLHTTATPTHFVILLLNGSWKNRTFHFPYWRQTLGNWSNSQKLSPAVPVRHIIRLICIRKFYIKRGISGCFVWLVL